MPAERARYTCLLIGQMTADEDMDRLNTLRSNVLEPILKPVGYRVVLPDRPHGSPEIFRKVMQMIDTAELLVADVTDDNANVYYELAVRHSLGLPYVLVGQHGPTFDLKDLDTIVYEQGRPQARWDEIKEKLDTAHAAALERRSVENPISGFYDAPLAEVSPASGLALGYYRNFVEPLVRQVRTHAGSVEIEGEEVLDRQRNRTRLEVWIPNVLAGAYPDAISDLLLQTDPPRLLEARVGGPHRSFSVYALPDRHDGVVLVDVPTTLNVVVGAIRGRYSALQVDQGSDEWASLEAQEIGRFSGSLKRRLREADAKAIRSRVDIVVWAVPGE